MEKLELVKVTLEQREVSVKEDLEREVGELEALAKRIGEKHGEWSNAALLDTMAGHLESALRRVRDLQARDKAAGELRSAYNFLVRE